MHFPKERLSRIGAVNLLLGTLLLIGALLWTGSAPLSPIRAAAGSPPSGLQDYERWFGSTHSHVHMDGDDGAAGSDGTQAFNYARNLPHLRYFIVTPHLHASRSGSATLWSETTYDTLRTQAQSATTAGFAAIAGIEVSTINSGGHWNLFNAQDLVGQDHPDGDWNDADDYYEHIAGLGAAGENIAAQFNHPHNSDFGNRYDPNAAPYVGTLAVSSGPAYSTASNFSDSGGNSESVWEHFLDMGWKLAPSADQDNHNPTWGASSTEYTVIVRPRGTALTPANVVQGLREHMAYATEDANMQIGFLANGWSMGQTVGGSPTLAFTIWWNNPSETIRNNNNGTARAETANDALQNIWIYKNGFTTPVATYQPNTISGTWTSNIAAAPGDWFVVKFQDTSTLATSGRTTDLTWSAPIWYDPAHADVPLTLNDPEPETVAVNAIALSGPVTLTVGAVSAITATVGPVSATLPITYVWQIQGQAPFTHTGGLSDPATFTWEVPGVYTLTVTADNGTATVLTHQTIAVLETVQPVAPVGITLVGPTDGSAGMKTIFTATVAPLSTTLPITYIWQSTTHPPITHTNGGLTDTADFQWALPGTHQITVVARNAAGQTQQQYSIIVTAATHIYLPIVLK